MPLDKALEDNDISENCDKYEIKQTRGCTIYCMVMSLYLVSCMLLNSLQ